MKKKGFRSQGELLTKTAILKGLFPADIAFTAVEADRFLDYIVDESRFKENIPVIRMDRKEKNLRGLEFAAGAVVLHPHKLFTGGTTMVASTDLSYGKRTLTTQKVRGCVPVYDDDLEDNIEGDAFADHLMRMIAAKIANELEDSLLMSAPAPDEDTQLDLRDVWAGLYYSLLTDTWFNKVGAGTAHILTATTDRFISSWNDTTKLWEFKFAEMLKAMPNKYKRNLSELRFMLAPAMAEDYVNVLASRGTILGDKAILTEGPTIYKAVKLAEFPLLPTDLGVPASGVHGESTVDVNSAAGQKVLSVAAPTAAFTAGDKVLVGAYDSKLLAYKAEVCEIDTIQADVSLTMVENLANTHLAADAEPVEEVTADGSFCVLTRYGNVVLGIQRLLKMESERDAANERTLFYFSLRADFAVQNIDEVVMYDHLAER